ADAGTLIIPVKSESLKASTIKISGIKLTLDRTVPEGALTAKVKGLAVVENYSLTDETMFTTDYAAKFVLANCVTPAPPETKGTAVFKIGETKYTVNGEEKTMDVAAYTKDGRTFLPVRFVANAVGVSDANILWDGATQKVTIFKGDRVVQMTIGSKVLMVNGVSVTMDVAPETVSGRTMLPIRFVAQALGADIQWNPETQEVTINF
ncbi:copper amine oxidase N-terminal domain-containing protein, partial [Candidatus Bipolaricaulota bacterium]|nr:copper amine oxidase N-terminal domain-containing protein [Candidatus Bipolaricaulota bacterium]